MEFKKSQFNQLLITLAIVLAAGNISKALSNCADEHPERGPALIACCDEIDGGFGCYHQAPEGIGGYCHAQGDNCNPITPCCPGLSCVSEENAYQGQCLPDDSANYMAAPEVMNNSFNPNVSPYLYTAPGQMVTDQTSSSPYSQLQTSNAGVNVYALLKQYFSPSQQFACVVWFGGTLSNGYCYNKTRFSN